MQLVFQPLDGGSRAVDVSFEGIEHLSVGGKTDRGDEAVGSFSSFLTDIDHHGGACAIGGFTESCLITHLSGECTVTVTENAGNLNWLREQTLTGCLAVDGIAGQSLGHHAARDSEHLQEVIVPIQRMDVKQ